MKIKQVVLAALISLTGCAHDAIRSDPSNPTRLSSDKPTSTRVVYGVDNDENDLCLVARVFMLEMAVQLNDRDSVAFYDGAIDSCSHIEKQPFGITAYHITQHLPDQTTQSYNGFMVLHQGKDGWALVEDLRAVFWGTEGYTLLSISASQ